MIGPNFNLRPVHTRFNILLGILCCCLMMVIIILTIQLNKSSVKPLKKIKPLPVKVDRKFITLNYKDIQVRAVLQLLADFSGVNIVVSDSVTGHMTLQLHKLPWQQALDIILTMQGLDKRKIGNVLLIEKAPLIAVKPIELSDKKPKFPPMQFAFIQVNYAKATDIAAMLNDKNNSLLSKHGILSVDPRTNIIWVQDTGVQIAKIKSLIKQLDILNKQVIIEARIVNMAKNCENDLGVRFGLSTTTPLNEVNEGSNIVVDASPLRHLNIDLSALPLEASPAAIGIALAKLNDHVLLDMELSALESEGRAQIIASPRLMTTNQHSAMIEAGEDIPYQETNLNGATSVAFKKAVLSLNVTPQITPDGKLLMDLLINQDSDSGRRVQGVPILFTKSLKTNVLVNDGQTIVLGGIYKKDKNNTVVMVPFLGKLPVVGYLFSRKQMRIRKEELLIFITPRIIRNNKKENKEVY